MAEDNDMHWYHYIVENLIDEVFVFIFLEFGVVHMTRLCVIWSPALSH